MGREQTLDRPPDQPLINQVRAFWNRRPCNIRHSPKAIGTREYFDEVEARKYFVEPHIPGFAQFARWNHRRVLEIGCGLGTDAVNFARAGADVTVVELSDESLSLCRQRFAVYGLTGRFFKGNVEELSRVVPVEPFDLVYAFGVLHHTPNPAHALAEIRKYLGPQSELRIMLYAKWSWKVLWILCTYGRGAFWRLSECVQTYSEAQFSCPVTFCYSCREIRVLLRDFQIVEMRKDHIFPYRIAPYTRYRYERVWYFRWMPRWLFRWLERRLGWHTLVVATLKDGSMPAPDRPDPS